MPGVVLEKVSRRFGDLLAVDEVDLSVRDGEFLTLLGPSGCGKTTTLRMVAGLEQNTGGRIRIGERVVSDAATGFFTPPDRRQLGMVFQSYAIWPHMTVFDNVAYPLRVRRRPSQEVKKRVEETLRLVEMAHLAERPAPALSGGQQQRVAIARALAFSPQVLLLDEPLSNLDARLRTQMGDEFRALQRRLGITSIYVTHDQQEALALSDTVVVMHAGCVLQSGPPEEVYMRPANRQVAAFFGAPNLMEATAESCREDVDGTRATVRGSGWEGECRTPGPLVPGTRVLVIIRPEHLRLADPSRPTQPGEMVWRGKVLQSVFRGMHRSLVIETERFSLTAEVPASSAVKVGEAVSVFVPAGSAWGIADAPKN